MNLTNTSIVTPPFGGVNPVTSEDAVRDAIVTSENPTPVAAHPERRNRP